MSTLSRQTAPPSAAVPCKLCSRPAGACCFAGPAHTLAASLAALLCWATTCPSTCSPARLLSCALQLQTSAGQVTLASAARVPACLGPVCNLPALATPCLWQAWLWLNGREKMHLLALLPVQRKAAHNLDKGGGRHAPWCSAPAPPFFTCSTFLQPARTPGLQQACNACAYLNLRRAQCPRLPCAGVWPGYTGPSLDLNPSAPITNHSFAQNTGPLAPHFEQRLLLVQVGAGLQCVLWQKVGPCGCSCGWAPVGVAACVLVCLPLRRSLWR